MGGSDRHPGTRFMNNTITASPAPINLNEYLSDIDVAAMRRSIAQYLPAGWFASEPELVTGDSSNGIGLARFARLHQINGPKLSEQLCIWREKRGFVVTDAKVENSADGRLGEWPAVATVEAAVRSIEAHITDLLRTWGLRHVETPLRVV